MPPLCDPSGHKVTFRASVEEHKSVTIMSTNVRIRSSGCLLINTTNSRALWRTRLQNLYYPAFQCIAMVDKNDRPGDDGTLRRVIFGSNVKNHRIIIIIIILHHLASSWIILDSSRVCQWIIPRGNYPGELSLDNFKWGFFAIRKSEGFSYKNVMNRVLGLGNINFLKSTLFLFSFGKFFSTRLQYGRWVNRNVKREMENRKCFNR